MLRALCHMNHLLLLAVAASDDDDDESNAYKMQHIFKYNWHYGLEVTYGNTLFIFYALHSPSRKWCLNQSHCLRSSQLNPPPMKKT